MTLMTATGATRFIRHGHACLGVAGPAGLTLTAGGHNNSPLWSRNPTSGAGQLHSWSPWGSGKAADGLPGFNGERCDPVSGSYHLGNGYRAYNPVLMRFNCPDSLSPFGAGGINPYAYCAGDPVNHTDPTGHVSWQSILGFVTGTIGLLLAGISAGTSIEAAGGIMAALGAESATSLVTGGLGVVADATGIASIATEGSNPSASAVLGWTSMATGLATMTIGGLQRANEATTSARQRLGNILHTGLSGRGAPVAANAWANNITHNFDYVGGIQRTTRPTDIEIAALQGNINRLRQSYEGRISRPVPSWWRMARRTASINDFPQESRMGIPLYYVGSNSERAYIATVPRYSQEFLRRMPMNIHEELLYTNVIPTGAEGLLRGEPSVLSVSNARDISPPSYSEVAGGLPSFEQATAGLPTYEEAMRDL